MTVFNEKGEATSNAVSGITMQIVIRIPKDDYIYIKRQVADGIINPLKVCIANGTPLPKGHGRLIDADALWDLYHDNDYDFYAAIDSATTIIEGTEGKE